MKNEKFSSQLTTYFKRHMAFRKADEFLFCSENLNSFLKTALLRQKQLQLLSLLSMNKYIFL
jgi:hypothetical protein